MRSVRTLAVVFVLAAVTGLLPVAARAQNNVGAIAPASRSCQLTGQFETTAASGWNGCLVAGDCVQAGNQTETQAGLRGVDLGSSFSDDAGKTYMLFGDTWPAIGPTSAPWSPLPPNTSTSPWTDPGAGFTVPRVASSDSWG
jgi:hypothetical protein